MKTFTADILNAVKLPMKGQTGRSEDTTGAMTSMSAVSSITEKEGTTETPKYESAKRPRLFSPFVWTPKLHEQFVDAVNSLGGCHIASPEQVLKLMNVKELTLGNIKSHLQNHRLFVNRIETRQEFHPNSLPMKNFTADILKTVKLPMKGQTDRSEDTTGAMTSMSAVSSITEKEGTTVTPRYGSAKRPRLFRPFVWTQKLHRKFVGAVNLLGGYHIASPKQVLKLMNVKELTLGNIKSHLQMYQLCKDRIKTYRSQGLGAEDGTSSDHQLFDEMAQGSTEGGVSGSLKLFGTKFSLDSDKGGITGAQQAFGEVIHAAEGIISRPHQVFKGNQKLSEEVQKIRPAWQTKNRRFPLARKRPVVRFQGPRRIPMSVGDSEISVSEDVIPELVSEGIKEEGTMGTSQKQLVSASVPAVEDPSTRDPNPNAGVFLEKGIFFKVLTPNDVGELNSLFIPKDFAEIYFPKLSESLLLNFEDPAGKLWTFRYIYLDRHKSYVLTEGWSCFVQEKQLHAGDTVSFHRGVGGKSNNTFFICWTHEADAAPIHLSPPPVSNIGSLISEPSCVSDNQSFILHSAGVTDVGSSISTPNIVDDNFMSSSGSVGYIHAIDSFISGSPYSLGPAVPFNEDFMGSTSGFLDIGFSLMPPCPSSPFHNEVAHGSVPTNGRILDNALLYCSLFPPDYEFEKETMVQLWMADGIFIEEPMEKEAHVFFGYCIGKGYFWFCRTNSMTGNAMYKFNARNHIAAIEGIHITRIEGIFCLSAPRRIHIARIEDISYLSDISPEVSHVSIRCHDLQDSTAFCSLKKFEQLRTLIFFQACALNFKHFSRDFFLSLGLLRVLNLSQARLMELPSSIGKMKSLCYLDLSDTPIKRLPEAIDCLTNLQTLKLRGCSNLSTLPKGTRKLVNLRYLGFDVLGQLQSMPQGMGALTSLRTLSAFLVGVEEGCSIRQLKNMNNLSGSFCISRLENVLSENEVEEACLSNKTQIRKLELHWSDSQDEYVGYGKILSSLQPNSSLEELCISCYGGFELPHWISNPAFSKLVSITLFECENCLVLPSFGELPSLKFLSIVDFHKLKVIGRNFCGGVGTPGYIAFPNLESLNVENMLDLEEWSGIENSDFPHLLKLTIKNCPKLHSLFTLSGLYSLEKLEISHCAVIASCLDDKLPAQVETFIIEGCPFLSEKVLNDGGQDWLKVAHIPHIWIDHQELSFGQGSSQGVRECR